MKSTQNYLDSLNKLKIAINNVDSILIGAGAGLSTAAGYTYSGDRFIKNFADFNKKYGISDMYSGGFYPFESSEEYWAWWSRHIYLNRYIDDPNDLYKLLLNVVKNNDYFVLTTNVDHCFQKAGFDKDRLFYTQGDYGLLQCSEPCCQETFDNENIIKEMLAKQQNMKIPTELIPKCPHCGKEMTTNLRADDRFVQDDGWYKANDRYNTFLENNKNSNILYLELGVGYNTPGIIKYPFWRYTFDNKNATYACINFGEAYCPNEIEKQSILIDMDIYKVIKDLTK